jgi:uncharacterized membrane protein YdjX (TVP38/TMEM64 family)
MAEDAPRRRTRLRLAVLVGSIVLLWVIGHQSGLLERLDAAEVRRIVRDAGALGFVVYVAMFAAGTMVQAPGWLFVAAACLAWGRGLGFLAAWVGALVAVSAQFAIARNVGGSALVGLRHPLARRLLARLDEHPFRVMLILRLIFWVGPPVNYALALSGVRYRTFLAAAALGLIGPTAGLVLLIDRIAG